MKFVDKSLHGITQTTLNSADRQNVDSAKKMCSEKVIRALIEHIEDNDATVMFLKFMSKFYHSFKDPDRSFGSSEEYLVLFIYCENMEGMGV